VFCSSSFQWHLRDAVPHSATGSSSSIPRTSLPLQAFPCILAVCVALSPLLRSRGRRAAWSSIQCCPLSPASSRWSSRPGTALMLELDGYGSRSGLRDHVREEVRGAAIRPTRLPTKKQINSPHKFLLISDP
jgi:hypothetical protein